MIVTDFAQQKITEYIDKSKSNVKTMDIFFRVTALPGKCHELRYKMKLDSERLPDDEPQLFPTCEVVMDRNSYDKLIYSTLDFIEEEDKVGFHIFNMNQKKCCEHGHVN